MIIYIVYTWWLYIYICITPINPRNIAFIKTCWTNWAKLRDSGVSRPVSHDPLQRGIWGSVTFCKERCAAEPSLGIARCLLEFVWNSCGWWCPSSLAKLTDITWLAMVYGRYNELVNGVYKPTNITGGHHPVRCCFDRKVSYYVLLMVIEQ